MKREIVHTQKFLEGPNASDETTTSMIKNTSGPKTVGPEVRARHLSRPRQGLPVMLLAFLLPAATALSAAPRLVKDINCRAILTNSSNPGIVVEMNGFAFFVASNALSGVELWKSDGTEAGTVLVKDIYPGVTPSLGNLVTVRSVSSEGPLFFTAGVGGKELWSTDGSAPNTKLVKAFAISGPRHPVNVNGILYFAASDGAASGVELWKCDPAVGTPSMVADINVGAGSSYPSNLVNLDGTLFFVASDGGGVELWKSDAGGTVVVKPVGGPTTPRNLVKVGTRLFLIAATTGRELWKSDGTADGTVSVKVWATGQALANLVDVNGRLFFTAGMAQNELWKSDGADADTLLLKTYGTSLGEAPRFLVNVAGTLFFAGTFYGVPAVGNELWKSDGTAGGTVPVKDIRTGTSSYPSMLLNANGTLYFIANDGVHGPELWKSDGTDLGTEMVKDIYPFSTGQSPGILGNVGSRAYLVADDYEHGRELWKSDGTEAATVLVKDINPTSTRGSTPKQMVGMNGKLYFAADDGVNGTELWTSDGTEAGTVLFKNIYGGSESGNPRNMIEFGGKLYFAADDSHGTELWTSDGTEPGTTLFMNINPLGSSSPASLVKVGNMLFFTADDGTHGGELWQSDGTVAGTKMVADIYEGTGGSNPYSLVEMGGKLYFGATDETDGFGLWQCFEFSPGVWLPWMVKNIYPSLLVNVNGRLFFAAGSFQNELWKSDGTTASTEMLKAWSPSVGFGPRDLVNVNGTLFFSADLPDKELWRSGGTAASTVRAADINPGLSGSNPHNLVGMDSMLYFAADEGVNGTELWKHNPQTWNSGLVKNINASGSSEPMNLVNVDGTLYFAADDGVNGRELWRFDPSTQQTELVQDLMPGPVGSDPGAVLKVGQTLFFAATNVVVGAELFALDLLPPPTTVWVDDDYSPADCGGHQWGYDAFNTIQAGIDAVAIPGIVYVATGTYPGDVTVSVTKPRTIEVGHSPGQVTINGNLTLSSVTTLEIELAGTTPGTGYDQLIVTGTANLAGTLIIKLIDSFYPPPGAVFSFLSAGACAGGFADFFYPSNEVGMVLNPTSTGISAAIVNVLPVIPSITDRTIDEATLLRLLVNATDADTPSQTLTYALSNSPAGAGVSATGEITWTPTEAQGPMTTNITVRVTDNGTPNLTVSRTFQVAVNEVNCPPGMGNLANHNVNPGQTLSFAATATDPDLPANGLAYSLLSPPAGATIDAGSGLFNWRPGVAWADTTNTIQVCVEDDGSPFLRDTNSFDVIVNALSGPVLLTPINYTTGAFTFSVSGPVGPDYVVQTSSEFTGWTGLCTNTPSEVPFNLTDTNAAFFERQFYRVLLGP